MYLCRVNNTFAIVHVGGGGVRTKRVTLRNVTPSRANNKRASRTCLGYNHFESKIKLAAHTGIL